MKNYQKQINILEEQRQNVIYDAEHHLDKCKAKSRKLGTKRNNLNRRIVNLAMSIVGLFKGWVDKDTYKLNVESNDVQYFLKNNEI